jgi:hypothetical protein
MSIRFLRATSWSLIVSLLALWLPATSAHAAIVGTDQLTATQAGQERAQVRDFLQRADVRNLLQQRGLDADTALTRVDAMTDSEVQQLSQQIDNLPAGGDVLGVLFAVFVILLVTDILGLTKVFPFTRPIR